MFDQVPAQIWLLIALAAVAFMPAQYVYRHIAHAPSQRDITRPSEDLSWRTSSQLALSLSILVALIAIAVFIFTPTAAKLARSPRFWPILVAACGAWSLCTVLMGFIGGRIQPFIRGLNQTYEREAQPKRFWASLVLNAGFGCCCIWLSFKSYEQVSAQALQDRCYDEHSSYAPREVLSACDELIAKRESSPDRLADYMGNRGIAHFRLGDYRQAIGDYSQAIRLNPRDPYSYYNRGLVYQDLGDPLRAISDFSAATRLRPDDADAYLSRGLIFLEGRHYDGAIADFSRAHQLAAKSPWPLANRGLAYAWKNDQLRAENDFKSVRALNPSNPVMLRGEALLRRNAGDTRGAVDRLTASLVSDPDNRWALRTRAELYWELGEVEKSRADDRRWLQLMDGARRGHYP